MPNENPYSTPKFHDEGQAAVHNGLLGLIRSKLGADLDGLKDDEVMEAAHLAYAPDMDAQDFVTGAKLVMSEKLHGAAQKEADRRATEEGKEGEHRLSIKNVHVTPQRIKGASVSGVPGVEKRKAIGKKIGETAAAVGKGLVESLGTPLPGFLEWVGAHGLMDEEIAPGVYETRFSGAAEQDKLEREAVRKMARATIDTAGWALGVGEVAGAIRGIGFTNTYARLGAEGALWGATYEGVDSALAGEAADEVATRAVRGAAIGASLTLGLGGAVVGGAKALAALAKRAVAESAAQQAAKAVPQSEFPALGLSPGERVALAIQRDGIDGMDPAVRRLAQAAQRGDLAPQEAAIQVLGNLGVINDPAGTAAVAALLEPRALVPVSTEMALTVPEMTARRLAADRERIAAAAAARRMAEEAGLFVEDLRRMAREERWGDPRTAANLAAEVPEPVVLPGGEEPILLGPGVAFKAEAAAALKEAAAQFPHLRMTRVPTTVQGKLMARILKIGDQAYDVGGTAHEVLGYSTSGKVIVRRQYPDGVWAYHALPATNLSPNPSGFLSALNRLEAGAKARLADINRHPRLSTGLDVLEGAREYIEIGIGKFGRAVYMGAKLGLSEDQVYMMWAKDMADHMRANGHGDQVQYLPKMFMGVKRDYGETMTGIVLRDSSIREGLYDAVDRMKKGGWVGHDWYDDTFPKLVELFGTPEDAARFADFLAITSANRNIDSNTNLALQAFAQWQVGEVPKGYGPNIDAMFARYAEAEGRLGRQPRVQEFAGRGSPKVSEFVRNVRGEDVNSVTLDVWMNRYLTGKETLQVKEKEAAKAIIREIAQREGMTPRQVQAAMWADARVAEQILAPYNKDGRVSMALGSLRPYEETTELFLRKRGQFLPEASALKATRANGGGTFYPESYKPFDKPGFSVALGGTALNAEKALPNQLREAVSAYLEPLKKVAEKKGRKLDFVVGTWVSEGKLYAEVGVVLPDRADALHLGNIANQQSVGQLGEGGAFVGVVETGVEDASANSVTAAKKALADWLDAPAPQLEAF